MATHSRYIVLLGCIVQLLDIQPLAQQFSRAGYVEICDKQYSTSMFDELYTSFDELITFLQTHPVWAHKLYHAKERFIRTKERQRYATDFIGLYDESQRPGRNQVSFYYATHFHDFLVARYPEFNEVPEIMTFFNMCRQIQEPYSMVFQETAAQLGIETIFASTDGQPPILLKVVKYFPAYMPTRPHYDGTAFSLFVHSTDNQSLMLAPYDTALTVDDFACPTRQYTQGMILIPGAQVTEFSLYPTPHIVAHSGNTRYATIAFAMRPHYILPKNELAALPTF